jgi:TatD DNase family protein
VRLVDSHGHVQADPFEHDRSDVLDAAVVAGVERLLVPGWDLPSSRDALELAVGASGAASVLPIDAGVGIHPHVASHVDGETWDAVTELAAHPAVLAIGETGLDYDREFSPRDAQLANLRRHLVLGRDLGKPVILHCRSKPASRDAQDDLIAELRTAGAGDAAWVARLGGRPPAVLHSFSGPVDYAEAALELGLAVSFSGLVFRKGEEPSADVVRLVPATRLLVETDAPYLPPPGAPRRRNEPAWVRVTARWVAEQRGDDPDTLGEALVAAYDATFRGTTGEVTT